MPALKVMSEQQLQALISKTRNNAPIIKLTPKEKFDLLLRQFTKKGNARFKKFHFKVICSDGRLYLFNGFGEQIKDFEDSFHGRRECRVFALFEVFLKTPIEKRQNGGHKIDFFEKIGE